MRFLLFLILPASLLAGQLPVTEGLLLDLDAIKGVSLEDGNKVFQWENQAPGKSARLFVKQDQGRKTPGSGRPTLRTKIDSLNGLNSLVFRQGELVNHDEDTFDSLSTGSGHTWITVIAVHQQRVGLKDVNSFFGNLRNGKKYEGIWGGLEDDNTLWASPRNGLTFGRFDKNNPLLKGPKIAEHRFYVIAGRMNAGTGLVKTELFVNSPVAIASGQFPINPKANPSKFTIGQERDAINHPGHESFDGEIARFLVYQRPLKDDELKTAIEHLVAHYRIKVDTKR